MADIPTDRISGNTGSDDCLAKIAEWIDECAAKHGCWSRSTQAPLPTRLVYVGSCAESGGREMSVRLIESSSLDVGLKPPYIALSYCWGGVNDFTTTMATLLFTCNLGTLVV